MSEQASKDAILIVDDVPENIRMLMEILKTDYATIPATSGEAALEKAQLFPKPDLIILDIMMPGIDGYETCRQLKENTETSDIPVIFITAVAEYLGDAKAFNLGAADYVTKPFNPATVLARVQHQIKLRKATLELQRLYKMALDANPLTGLPGNNTIRKHIEKTIAEESGNFVVYVDLDNFKAYNDKYGFARGDDVILFTASLLQEALAISTNENSFLGHIGGDDFVLLVPKSTLEQTVNFIIDHFDSKISSFYNHEDIKRQGIKTTTRQGKQCTVPLLSVSLGAVNIHWSGYRHYLEVTDACAQVKKKAKDIQGSSFFIDRRKH
jgi:diguanylate cyclase (GGDEF)-like protein